MAKGVVDGTVAVAKGAAAVESFAGKGANNAMSFIGKEIKKRTK